MPNDWIVDVSYGYKLKVESGKNWIADKILASKVE